MNLKTLALAIVLSIPCVAHAGEKAQAESPSAMRAPASIDGVTFDHFYEVRAEKGSQADCEYTLLQQKQRFEKHNFVIVNGPISCKPVSLGKEGNFEGYLEMYR